VLGYMWACRVHTTALTEGGTRATAAHVENDATHLHKMLQSLAV
jgi:hypothetical protein